MIETVERPATIGAGIGWGGTRSAGIPTPRPHAEKNAYTLGGPR